MQNRRDFLKKGLAAASLSGLAGSPLAAKSLSGVENSLSGEKDELIYRTLGKTGISIPVISMGTGNCSSPKLVQEAHRRGIKLFASSEYYQNGNNEIMIGEALRDTPRDSYMIMTGAVRGLEHDHETGLFGPGTNPEVYIEHANGCLKRLGVDYVDIFSLGFGAKKESVLYEPILKALENFKRQGKARYLSLTSHSNDPDAIRAAVDAGIYDIVTISYNFRIQNLEEINSALQYVVDAGLGVIAMKTMAGAWWDKEKTHPIDAPAALKWVLRNENIHSTIPDFANFDHLEKDLTIMKDLEMTEDEEHLLLPPTGDLTSGIYCQQCRECISQCTEKLDIPTLMRSYMYAYGYRNLNLAWNTLMKSGVDHYPCLECTGCGVSCSMGFNVKEKVKDIARLRNIPSDLISHS